MQEGVYLNGIRLDWAKISVKDSGDLKENPLDPNDIPNQIVTNLRIAFTSYTIQARFNVSNENKKLFFKTIQDIRARKEKVTLITNDEIIEDLIIIDMDRELDKYNFAFTISLKQFQVAKITSTGDPKETEKRQTSDNTTVGTQGVTASNAQGGYLT